MFLTILLWVQRLKHYKFGGKIHLLYGTHFFSNLYFQPRGRERFEGDFGKKMVTKPVNTTPFPSTTPIPSKTTPRSTTTIPQNAPKPSSAPFLKSTKHPPIITTVKVILSNIFSHLFRAVAWGVAMVVVRGGHSEGGGVRYKNSWTQ